jgi:hypothetical protein
MSNLTDFFPSGGGGGLTPKFEEFNASGTFTPSQALIDAGGYIEVFLVAGGAGGQTNMSSYVGGQGGEAQIKKMYLTTISGCTITIGSGGNKGTTPSAGGDSVFNGSSAGGVDFTSKGGFSSARYSGWGSTKMKAMKSPSWPGYRENNNLGGSAGSGINGYGAGGGVHGVGFGPGMSDTYGSLEPNTGQGGVGSNGDDKSCNGSSGYCLIKWYE